MNVGMQQIEAGWRQAADTDGWQTSGVSSRQASDTNANRQLLHLGC